MKQSKSNFYTDFSDTFKTWAEDVKDIRAAFIMGSQARDNHPADIWSDMDILLFTSKPYSYLNQSQWLDNLGKVLCSFSTYTVGGDPERLTLFEGGYQVDFVVAHTDVLDKLVASKSVYGNFHRGVKVLVDKDSVSHHIMPKEFSFPPVKQLTKIEFENACHMFWFVALYEAKQILRGELWVVKARDSNLKGLALQMIEWYEKCLHGNSYDTWHAGRFMSEWVSPDIWENMNRCFGHFDSIDSWNALIETTQLFKRLSHFVSLKMNYPISETESFVESWLESHKDKIS